MSLLAFEWLARGPASGGAAPLLLLRKVTVRLGHRLVLDRVDLELREGDQVRISGPNGSGKSTLLNAIMGVVALSEGSIRFRGVDLEMLATHERATLGIRYMRQRRNVFPSLTVRENLHLALGGNGYELFMRAFPDWKSDLPPDKRAGLLSGGQQQKLAWSATALSDASLLLADEPSAGIFDFVTDLGRQSLMIVEHKPQNEATQ